MSIMDKHGDDSDRNWSRISKLNPELIELFRRTQPQSFEDGLDDLRAVNYRLLRELIVQAELHSRTIQEKRAYIEGALFIIAINRFAEQYEQFKASYEPPETASADGDGEALPPSV